MHIHIHEFVLIYDRQTQQKKLCSKIRASPLSLCTRERVCLVPKKLRNGPYNLRIGLVKFCFCTRTIRTPSKIQDLYESISMPYSQPQNLQRANLLSKKPKNGQTSRQTVDRFANAGTPYYPYLATRATFGK
jgi:hypothetical protein